MNKNYDSFRKCRNHTIAAQTPQGTFDSMPVSAHSQNVVVASVLPVVRGGAVHVVASEHDAVGECELAGVGGAHDGVVERLGILTA